MHSQILVWRFGCDLTARNPNTQTQPSTMAIKRRQISPHWDVPSDVVRNTLLPYLTNRDLVSFSKVCKKFDTYLNEEDWAVRAELVIKSLSPQPLLQARVGRNLHLNNNRALVEASSALRCFSCGRGTWPGTLVPVFIPTQYAPRVNGKHFITASAMVRLYGIHDSTCKVLGLPVLF